MKNDWMKRGLTAALVVICAACSGSSDSGPSSESDNDALPTDEAPGDDDGVTDDDPPVYPACGTNPLPTSCAMSATVAFPGSTYGSDGSFAVTVETIANPRAAAPGVVSIYRPTGQTNVPVVFMSHAYGATDPKVYDVLMRNLASRGIAVVHSPYETFASNADRYADLWQGFTAAVFAKASVLDMTRVGFIGHSFGGGATPEMARRGFFEQGWGTSGRFMFILAPWYSWGSDYDTIPIDVRTVMEVFADDDANDHQIAVHDIWDLLPAGIERAWLMIRSDVCDCGLNADHVLPMSAAQTSSDTSERYNDYDRWGVIRRIDALAAYAFDSDSAARSVAYGEDTAMGTWVGCEGRDVRPLEASDAPITTTCVAPLYPYSERCANADPGAAGCE